MNCYPFIEAEKACRRKVKRACELLKVSRAAFYAHLAGPSQREHEDAGLIGQIRAVHEESKGRYGAPRVHAELARRGQRHSRKRVARLMRRAGLPRRVRRPAGAVQCVVCGEFHQAAELLSAGTERVIAAAVRDEAEGIIFKAELARSCPLRECQRASAMVEQARFLRCSRLPR
ncbi:MAG: transposase [Actinobacteria bacterium]|nr:transposase [Actinomycetota bacterium]